MMMPLWYQTTRSHGWLIPVEVAARAVAIAIAIAIARATHIDTVTSSIVKMAVNARAHMQTTNMPLRGATVTGTRLWVITTTIAVSVNTVTTIARPWSSLLGLHVVPLRMHQFMPTAHLSPEPHKSRSSKASAGLAGSAGPACFSLLWPALAGLASCIC